jgi:hypothetical protein
MSPATFAGRTDHRPHLGAGPAGSDTRPAANVDRHAPRTPSASATAREAPAPPSERRVEESLRSERSAAAAPLPDHHERRRTVRRQRVVEDPASRVREKRPKSHNGVRSLLPDSGTLQILTDTRPRAKSRILSERGPRHARRRRPVAVRTRRSRICWERCETRLALDTRSSASRAAVLMATAWAGTAMMFVEPSRPAARASQSSSAPWPGRTSHQRVGKAGSQDWQACGVPIRVFAACAACEGPVWTQQHWRYLTRGANSALTTEIRYRWTRRHDATPVSTRRC